MKTSAPVHGSSRMPDTDIVHSFAGKSVLIVGDLILDEYIWGKVRRLSPEAPVPVIEFENKTHRLGGAGNVAANIQNLGGEALLAGIVGSDPQGKIFLELLTQLTKERGGVFVVEDRCTTTKTRLMGQHQQIARVDYEQCTRLVTSLEDSLLGWAESQMDHVDICIVSDYDKGVVSRRVAQNLMSLARRYGKAVVVDPKGQDFSKHRGATLVKPNLHEVEKLFLQEISREKELGEAARRLLELLPGSALLITRGQRGMSLFRNDLPTVEIPSLARNVYDVTGAGDTVTAVLALALSTDVDIVAAAHLANRAAGIVVGKLGTAQVTVDELLTDGQSGQA